MYCLLARRVVLLYFPYLFYVPDEANRIWRARKFAEFPIFHLRKVGKQQTAALQGYLGTGLLFLILSWQGRGQIQHGLNILFFGVKSLFPARKPLKFVGGLARATKKKYWNGEIGRSFQAIFTERGKLFGHSKPIRSASPFE